jgi:hypothetical protein
MDIANRHLLDKMAICLHKVSIVGINLSENDEKQGNMMSILDHELDLNFSGSSISCNTYIRHRHLDLKWYDW